MESNSVEVTQHFPYTGPSLLGSYMTVKKLQPPPHTVADKLHQVEIIVPGTLIPHSLLSRE